MASQKTISAIMPGLSRRLPRLAIPRAQRRYLSSTSRSLASGTADARSNEGSGQSDGRAHAREWGIAFLSIGTGAGAVLAYQNRTSLLPSPLALDSASSPASGANADHDPAKKGRVVITLDELAKHNTKESLWVAIDGDVWDVTSFYSQHPGGAQIIVNNAGKDVSHLFKGIHPERTLELNLDESQRVGRLNEEAIAAGNKEAESEKEKIAKARAELFGVDSVVTLDDFEKYARPLLPTDAWEYYSFGADTEAALRNNSSAYDRIFFRPRILRDVSSMDLSTEVLGVESRLPIYATPVARMGMGQELGEIATTRAAANQGILQVLSHVASKSLQDVLDARAKGQQVGWQLYVDNDRAKAEKDVRQAIAAGAQSIWLTCDRQAEPRNQRALYGKMTREPAPPGTPLTREMPATVSPRHNTTLTWADVEWLRQLAPDVPIVVKGVGAWEDAEMARKAGADAVVLSNHGGRQLDFAHAPIQTLYDIHRHSPQTLSDAKFQVFVDGGIRRGTDVVKALCLGATAVGLGRPFIYAATGWGSEGIEKALMIMRQEIDIAMRSLGVTKIDQLGPEYLDCSKL